LEAASLNIRINASSMKNRDKAEQLLTEMEEKIGRSHQESQEIYRKALEKLS
jgi:formiminotetrahydrofolate cyclodeaminase